jgi:hypothetical protein
VLDTNRFIHPRRPDHRYVTAWVGIFDLDRHRLTYVDAAHGHAILFDVDGSHRSLRENGGPAIGMFDDAIYQPAHLDLRDARGLLLLSDGIIEQFGLVTHADGSQTREQFEQSGVINALLACRAMLTVEDRSIDADRKRDADGRFDSTSGSGLNSDSESDSTVDPIDPPDVVTTLFATAVLVRWR